ncbi:MAG: AzlC family ABC transporter permease [Rhodocyclaceae bacterium]|nr:AzlC family ABC transporter permease [Rhodocyclaceae bacterium]
MNDAFRRGAREGFFHYLPLSIGLIPWALVTGVAMRGAGFSVFEAMGMNIIVFAGTAQLGTLPLIVVGAPMWMILATALALNLRFVIFSAAIAPAFEGVSRWRRILSGYLLTDGVFASCSPRMLASTDKDWRLGFYLAPSVWCWALWQVLTLIGVLGASVLPTNWSLDFMASIALMVLLVPIISSRPMLVAALAAGATAVLLHDLPLKLGLIAAIFVGIGAGFLAERWATENMNADTAS